MGKEIDAMSVKEGSGQARRQYGELGHAGTVHAAADLLWVHLVDYRGYAWERGALLPPSAVLVEFYCSELALVIEICPDDPREAEAAAAAWSRATRLEIQGYNVVMLDASLVVHANVPEILAAIDYCADLGPRPEFLSDVDAPLPLEQGAVGLPEAVDYRPYQLDAQPQPGVPRDQDDAQELEAGSPAASRTEMRLLAAGARSRF